MKFITVGRNISKEATLSASFFLRLCNSSGILTWMGAMILLPGGCAKVGAPTGGIKDTKPPKYIEGIPENRSTHFNGKEISFRFDEYIQFKDLNKQLLISPPLKVKPDVRIKDKSVRINLKNELLPGTTYTVNFGNAISDLNEGNIVPDFEFVFSTGDSIDSLAVTGQALNAFDHKPLKDQEVMVMLYENLSDSAPLVEIPRYMGRASVNGLFSINNIHTDTCRIIALNDVNGNLKYDPESESIAFLDTFLMINANNVKPVTFIKDTLKIGKNEKKKDRSGKTTTVKAKMDTTVVQGRKLNALNVSLFYFLEETDKVYITGKKRELPEQLLFTFNRSLHDSVKVRPLNYKPGGTWFVKETSMNRDSLIYWITDSIMARKDTLLMAVSYTSTDSSGHFFFRNDTITLRYQKPLEKSTGGKKSRTTVVKEPEKKMKLEASIANRGTQNLNKPLIFTLDKPLSKTNADSIELYKMADSIMTIQPFTCTTDSSYMRKFKLTPVWQENTQYRLLLKPGAVKDIYGNENDSVGIKFVTQKAEYYGRILVSVTGKHFPIVLQVIDQKGRITNARNLNKPDKIIIDYLPPDKYTLKVIVDSNKNGKWDTGNFLMHRQPETVFFYKMPVDLRSNWDYEVNWEIPD